MRLSRNTIILAVVAVLLGVGIYFGFRYTPPENAQDGNTPQTFDIFKIEKEKLSEITLKQSDTEMVLVKNGDQWTVKGHEAAKVDKSKIDNIVDQASSITSDKLIEENAQNLDQYGLASPEISLTVKTTDGTAKTFFLGDMAPTKAAYYFKESDNAKVYTITSSKGEAFLSKFEDLRDQSLYTANKDDLVAVNIEGKNRKPLSLKKRVNEDLQAEGTMKSQWYMTAPVERDTDDSTLESSLLSKVSQFSVKSFVEDTPSNLAKYGLDKPEYTISFTDKDNKTVKFLLGAAIGDSVYVRVDGEQPVYTMDAAAFEYKDIDSFSIMAKLIYIVNIDKVEKITINAAGKESVLETAKEGDKYNIKINGQAANESAGKKMYQEIIGLTVDGEAPNAAYRAPEVSYVFHHNNGAPDVKVEFVSLDDRNYAVFVDGKCQFSIKKKTVSQMLDALANFEKNPTEEPK